MVFKNHGRDPAPENSALVRKFYWSPFWALLKLTAIPAIPIILMLIYGQPGLRMQYWWQGSDESRSYTRCQYLVLFDGWQDFRPAPGINQCLLMGWFPFTLKHLTGE